MDDLVMARTAIEKGDFRHAAHHLAGCMTAGPTDDVLAAILALHERAPDVLALVPLEEGVFYGQVVLRAALLVLAGRGGEAVPLVLSAQAAAPAEPLLAWAEKWLAQPAIAGALPLDALVGPASRCAENRKLARALLPLLERLHDAREPNGRLTLITAKIARELGEVDHALAIGTAGFERAPSAWAAIAIAKAHHAKQSWDDAIAWFRRAADLDPACGARLDEGDVCLDRGRWKDACAAYERVARDTKDWEWAHPSALFARAFGLGDAAAADELRALAAKGSRRAVALRDHLEPYRHALRPPSASCLPSARQSARARTTIRSMGISSLEPPSAIFAARWMLRLAGVDDAFPVSFASIPSPDPRASSVPNPVWVYDQASNASPAVPAPAPEVRAAIADFAKTAYDLDAWARAARDLLPGTPASDLRAVMVHPPDPPSGADPASWLFRVQVAAAMILAWRADPPGELAPLLRGPVDWTTTAALIALAGRARASAPDQKRIGAFLVDQMKKPTGPIYWECVFLPLLRCAIQIDALASTRATFEDIRRQNDRFGS